MILGSLLMTLKQPRSFAARLFALTLPFWIVACYVVPCPPLSPLEAAASYDWLSESRYSEPFNMWVKNPRLERFLLKAYASGGIEDLKSQYGFDCTLRDIVPPCTTCYVCRMSIRKQTAEAENLSGGELCGEVGQMLMQVEIGPGSESFSAMTYWERPPLKNRK
jgi:hypothetical protein